MSMKRSIRSVLEQTLEDIEIRSQIESCMNELISDVEFSLSIQEKICTKREIMILRRQIQEKEYIIAESLAVRQQQQRKNVILANQMTKELWNASCEIGSLLSIKERYDDVIAQYDELLAKYLQAEDLIAQNNNNTNTTTAIATTDNTGTVPSSNPQQPLQESPSTDSVAIEETEQDIDVLLSVGARNDSTSFVVKSNQPALINDTNTSPTDPSSGNVGTVNDDISQDPAVVLLDVDTGTNKLSVDITNSIEIPPTLDQLETEILLHVFLFLDPLDVLNAAQVNVAMYSRVDSIFNPPVVDDNNQQESIVVLAEDEEVDQKPAAQPFPSLENQIPVNPSKIADTPKLVSIPATQPPTIAAPPPIASPPSINPQPTIVSPPTITSQPTIVAPTPLKIAPANESTGLSLQASKVGSTNVGSTSSLQPSTAALPKQPIPELPSSTTAAGQRGGIFSMLQPMVGPSTSPMRNRTGSVDNSKIQQKQQHQSGKQGTYQPLNAAMASSMAAKLSDTELNAIIMMTERLKQKEQLAVQYKAEKDALAAKLDGTESVKQFLIGKVRDMEASLNAYFNNEIKMAQQTESDQEIISYLDSKVQGLERQCQTLESEKKAALDELDSVRKRFNEKATVMGDMLQFERQKLQDKEREWKATKKVLVKEVKSLRSQLLAPSSFGPLDHDGIVSWSKS